MIIFQDQREKKGHHKEIEEYCEKNGIDIIRKRLEVGDYMIPNGNISVDTKQDLTELAADLYRDKLAYNKKYKKCYRDKVQLVVLVEEKVSSLTDIAKWRSPHTKITGKLLLDMMNTVRVSYGVKFMFCDKKDVGATVMSILQTKSP
jgi:ERCC4-type nuclease